MYTLVIVFLFVFFIALISGGAPPTPEICYFTNSDYYIGNTLITRSEWGTGCPNFLSVPAVMADKSTSDADLTAFLNVRRGLGKCKNFEVWTMNANGTVGVMTPAGFRLEEDTNKKLLPLCKNFTC